MRLRCSPQPSSPIRGTGSQLGYGLAPVQRCNFVIPRKECKALGFLTRCLSAGFPQALSIPWLWGRRQLWRPSCFLGGTADPAPACSPGPRRPLSGFSISSPAWQREVAEQRNTCTPEGAITLAAAWRAGAGGGGRDADVTNVSARAARHFYGNASSPPVCVPPHVHAQICGVHPRPLGQLHHPQPFVS